jgi:polar amino acid transport system substrate-binding protein
MIVGAAREDAPDFIFSDPIGVAKSCFYTKKDSKFKYTGIASLNSIKLGVVKDYAYFDDLNAYVKQYYGDRSKIDEHFGDSVQDKMLQKLEAGRLGAFVEDPNVASYVLKKHPEIKDVVEVGCVQIGNLYVALPPKNPKSKDRVAKINVAIDKLTKSGKLNEILAKYGVKHW